MAVQHSAAYSGVLTVRVTGHDTGVFSKADVDGDGEVTLVEFERMIQLQVAACCSQ